LVSDVFKINEDGSRVNCTYNTFYLIFAIKMLDFIIRGMTSVILLYLES